MKSYDHLYAGIIYQELASYYRIRIEEKPANGNQKQ